MNWQQSNEQTWILPSSTGRVIAMVYYDQKYNLYEATRYNQKIAYFKDLHTAKSMAEPVNTRPTIKAVSEPQADLMPWDS